MRTVRDPDGREWRVRLRHHRLPDSHPFRDDALLERYRSTPPFGPAIAVLIVLVRITVVPVLEATVGRRPWIEASSSDETLVWRATGRTGPQEALDEIANALERGDPRPRPLETRWVGREGGPRLPNKIT